MNCKKIDVPALLLDVTRGDVKALELLAQAAGYKYYVVGGGVHILGLLDGHDRNNWNPAEDDGDALRLAVSSGNTDLSLLVGNLAMAEQTGGLTGIAVVRRAIVWTVLARHLAKVNASPAVTA